MNFIQIIAAACVLIGILLLKNIVNVVPSLVGCLFRWKECLNIEDSLRLSSDRNIFAVFMILPFCIAASGFHLYCPDFLSGLQPAAFFGCTCGIFAGYCLTRTAFAVMIRKPKIPEKIYKAANRTSFSFFCIMAAAVLAAGGICSFADIAEKTARTVLLYIILTVYAVAIVRKFQIFGNYCSFFTAFLYLCVLEFLPTGILVISAALF